MPLTPNDVIKIKAQQKEDNLKSLFDHIDDTLVKGESPIKLNGRLNEEEMEEIVQAYEEAGWLIKIEEGEDEKQHHQVTLTPNTEAEQGQVASYLNTHRTKRPKDRYMGQHYDD